MATAGFGGTTRRELRLSRIGRRPFMETILLVDDEPNIVALAHKMLEGEGYEILDALNAEEAVRVAATHAGPIHLLLTDIVMPGASGQDLAQLLGLQRPDLRVLYMSSFAIIKGQRQFAEVENGLDLGAPIVLKPFTLDRLLEKVQEVLAARPASPFDQPADPWRSVS
jgi:two-component system, cell cycle sensor histidine kinase and response regulator CckA